MLHKPYCDGLSDGSFVYTPAAGFTGDDTFSVTITDGLMSVTVIVTIHVT